LVLFLSHQQKVKVLFSFSAGNLEFPALASIVFCFGFAALSAFLGLSVAHGAFLSGSDCHSRERNVILQMMTPCEYVFFSFASAFSWT
jgi:Kef-type K+ transport system membrane component KefB